jgi:hypothetical protein
MYAHGSDLDQKISNLKHHLDSCGSNQNPRRGRFADANQKHQGQFTFAMLG